MPPTAELVTVGYEGRSAAEVVEALAGMGVSVLVDVRMTPLSRKPGLSKIRLAERLAEAGIKYLHLRSLGNPKANRDRFRAGEESALSAFRGLLVEPAGADGVSQVTELLERERVGLLCFEREPHLCHRQLVAERVCELAPRTAVHHV